MPQIFVKIKRHLYWVVTHFEIWAASQISAVMDQSHRIWQSNGSAAHVARFVWNRRLGPAALPQVALDLFWKFWLFLQPGNSQFSNCQIRNTRISTEAVTPC
jgi:hypothetical protein